MTLRLSLALAGSLAASAALSADLPAPVFKAGPVTPAFSWTGFYIGGHLGGGASSNWSSTAARAPVAAVQWNLGFGQDDTAVLGGAQAGYNWQFAPAGVIGIEADLTWTGLGGKSDIAPVRTTVGPVPNSFAFMNRDVDWIGSVRGRMGYAYDGWLAYGTGGLAFGRINYSGDVNFTGNGGSAFPVSFGETQWGWVAGGGVEYALRGQTGNWTVRAEYLYYSFDSASATGIPAPFFAGATNQFQWSDTNIHSIRFGLNYKFGG